MARFWLAGLLAVLGCSDGGDSCTDTYAEGPGSSFSGTSCENKKPSQELIDSAADAGLGPNPSCVDIQAFGCDPGTSECRETYRRACGTR